MPYEDDYKMWLENMLIESNPDWVCDEMHDTEVTHDWCYKYCGKDDLYITPKCLHMYYHHIVRADRKTENSSEKPNNSTISKKEQVEDKPQMETCKGCKHKNGPFCTVDGDCKYFDRYEPKDEPQTERRTDRDGDVWEWRGDAWYCISGQDEPQTDCAWR